MISDTDPLTAVQLNQITSWFGPTAFSKSSRNSGLVVDQNTNYVRITTTGTHVEGNDICLNEGRSATLIATKFILSETDQNDYQWSIVAGSTGQVSEATEVNSCSLIAGDDGTVHLITTESGIYGDYYVTICALKEGFAPEYLTIKIIGSILPDHIEIRTEQKAMADARRFYMNETMGT